MSTDTAHVAERIDRPAAEVYAYVSDPQHLTDWAPGLGSAVQQVDGDWFVESPMGRVKVEFAPPNEYGVPAVSPLTTQLSPLVAQVCPPWPPEDAAVTR